MWKRMEDRWTEGVSFCVMWRFYVTSDIGTKKEGEHRLLLLIIMILIAISHVVTYELIYVGV